MRQTKYVPGYGYITQYGEGFWKDAGLELGVAVGKRVANAIGDKLGRKIAEKIVPAKQEVLKELDILPSNGLPEDVRKALYGSGRKQKHLI